MRFRYITLPFLLAISSFALAQNQGYTPYGGFGIGELVDQTVAAQDMMGGTGVSFGNTFYTNLLNPAMIVKNRTIGSYKYVTLNVALKGNYNILQQKDLLQENFGMHLNNISLAFPIKPKWAMALSFRPYSIADFDTKQKIAISNSNYFNSIDSKTSGGLSRVIFINSFQIGKKLYLGIEGQHTFGNIQKDTTTVLTDGSVMFSNYNRNTSHLNLSGNSLKAGFGFSQNITKKWKVNIGGTYELGSTLKGQDLRTFGVLADGGNGPLYIQAVDTLMMKNVKTHLPTKYKAGISIENPYHFVISADYGITKWQGTSQYDQLAQSMYKNATEYNVGLEWLPNASGSNYLGQAFYRLGYKNVMTPYTINGVRIQDNSISMGISLPMGFKSASYIDLGASIGRRGVLTGNVIQENYTKISISFNLLSNQWFNKPKID